MKSKEEIVELLYASFGTGSGILFGIKERPIVEAIVSFTIAHHNPIPIIKETVDAHSEDKKLSNE